MRIQVSGSECLEYIKRPIGLVNKSLRGANIDTFLGHADPTDDNEYNWFSMIIRPGHGTYVQSLLFQFSDSVDILKFAHNINKRKIGYVTKKYADGGIQAYILGNEDFNTVNIDRYQHQLFATGSVKYVPHIGHPTYTKDVFNSYPDVDNTLSNAPNGESICSLGVDSNLSIDFDDMLDFKVEIPYPHGTNIGSPTQITYQQENRILTNDITTTPIFGVGVEDVTPFYFNTEQMDDPLVYLQGDLYSLASEQMLHGFSRCPYSFEEGFNFTQFKAYTGNEINSTNLVAVPYNIILTENYQFAQNYLENGTLPPDAYLFPLDWENLPSWDGIVPTGDEPEDYPDDNMPDDITRDFDPTPVETPSFTVNQLTNYNWYWLTVSDWTSFINWFWNDVGAFNDFDDIIAKVEGLYNNLASAVIMCRYYPVDVSWIGGTGTPSNLKLGMIEKAGSYDTLANNALRVQDIGHIKISQKYKSFMDVSPYSQLSLYLPFHGFVDLDIDIFNGHDLYVKALYDFMSGTIQYYLFYDNEVMFNTILCKMAMDIPVTLQTKNDRDSAIFTNVSSTIGGLIGAGVGIASGNPIGMAIGVTQGVSAFNSSNASAPMRVMGNVGESGAYLGCQHCYVIVRRPTIQASDGKKSNTEIQTSTKNLNTWKKNVGMLCGYGYKLGVLANENAGFTVCQSPRINFTNSAPLQSEVDEIYDYLEKGVIL